MLENIDLMNVLVLDIETVPQYASYQEVPPTLKHLWEQKTVYQRKENDTPESFYGRAGIWAEFGKIVCISVGMFANKQSFRVKSFYGDDEKALLERFLGLLASQPKDLCLCAHNGKEFDIPYICRRLLINNLPLAPQLHLNGKKPWEINHLDTLELWKFGDYKNYTSLNLLAAIFGIPTPKDDIDGSMVGEIYWQHKDLNRIKTYCQKDVVTTARILQKFKALPVLSDEQITYAE
ncbi:3'-5' exonuclease [Pelobium manganitolerans]|uniref:3'-5' exonuclease n=1 Tax=Pelobium manganitolerans TaxID=1842495 RepID=A0A419SAR4_9SPHI|nr:3'-5' exonuclease [Pelobium manganitolerans]RKD19520.1 3'-5' exonuclease [Pelobium manganitolerans]